MCPDKSILSAYFDGEVDSRWAEEIKVHLSECELCNSFVNKLKTQREMLHSAPIPCFEDSLDRVKNRIRQRKTISGSLRFWERKIPLPAAAAAAIIAASITLGTNALTMNRKRNPQLVDPGISNFSGYSIDLPGERLNEIFSLIDSDEADKFSSDSIVELPVDINLVFHGDSHLVRTAGYVGDESR